MRSSSHAANKPEPEHSLTLILRGGARMCSSGDVYFSHDLLFLSYTGNHLGFANDSFSSKNRTGDARLILHVKFSASRMSLHEPLKSFIFLNPKHNCLSQNKIFDVTYFPKRSTACWACRVDVNLLVKFNDRRQRKHWFRC